MADIDEKDGVEVMLHDDNEVEVTIEGESPPQKSPDEREIALNQMKQQLEETRRRAEQEKIARQRAEQYAYQQAQTAQYAKAEAAGYNIRNLQSTIDATEQTALNAERAYADAMAAGDYDTAAKAQRAMAAAETQIVSLMQQKSNLENYYQTAEGRVADAPPPPPMEDPGPPQDPVEVLASRLTPKSADWLRAHPEAAHKVNKLTAAHQAAVELEGITPETPEYFAFIERSLGMAAKAPAKKTMASAPVSSSSSYTSSRSSGGAESMVLSAAQVEQAVLLEPDLPREKAIELYAKNRLALIREGKLSA